MALKGRGRALNVVGVCGLSIVLFRASVACAQMAPPALPVDPALHVKLQAPPQPHLREQFIWTADDAAARDPALQSRVRGQNDKIAPHYFRAHFQLSMVPRVATLYLAGPRAATVTLNGKQVLATIDDGSRPKNLSVMTADVSAALVRGENVIAIEAVRGHSSLHTGANSTINQITYGEVLAVKIVPRGLAMDAPPVVVSDASWRSSLEAGSRWDSGEFDDSKWRRVESLGVLGSKEDFLQWNADAGLYAWPGYAGIGPQLRVFVVEPESVRDVAADGEVDWRQSSSQLLAMKSGQAVVVDFGREIAGRVVLGSAASRSQVVRVSCGESPEEAEKDKGYLGERTIVVPPNGTAYGPKSGFRYAKISFPDHATQWRTIAAQDITYPVQYLGSFQSSDPLVDEIWSSAAYTARLCMQDGIWDAPKRDRGRWMGDLDVTGRAIESVFGERELMERTMADIIGPSPVTREVNTIAGYSAAWISGEANLYRHLGNSEQLRQIRAPMLELLRVMDGDLDANGAFTNPQKHKVFVDWSEGLSSDTAEARMATELEFANAYREAAFLLGAMGDSENAAKYHAQAEAVRVAARRGDGGSTAEMFGASPQANAMAVVSGTATDEDRRSIWGGVLSNVGKSHTVITPYYNFYVLEAMAETGHSTEALAWMRQYWGGMLAEGASSFWEAYDLNWRKEDFHAHLQADGKTGYYVSLAHGWSSGPAAWLPEWVLGIHPTAEGFREVTIAPQLSGLAWAKGSEPTPRGVIGVDVRAARLQIDLPPGTRALVHPQFASEEYEVTRNGRKVMAADAGSESKSGIVLRGAGRYVIRSGAMSDAEKGSEKR